MWPSEQASEMDTLARFYQQSIVDALRHEAKKHLPRQGFYHPLTEALAKIVGWRRRYLVASEADRQTAAMFQDWLKNVQVSADVYSDWLSEHLNRQYETQAQTLERSAS